MKISSDSLKKSNIITILFTVIISLYFYFDQVSKNNIYIFKFKVEESPIKKVFYRQFYFLTNTFSYHNNYDPNDVDFLERYFAQNTKVKLNEDYRQNKVNYFMKFVEKNPEFQEHIRLENSLIYYKRFDYLYKKNDFHLKKFKDTWILFASKDEINNVMEQIKFSKNLILSLYYDFPSLTEGYYSSSFDTIRPPFDLKDVFDQQTIKIYEAIYDKKIDIKEIPNNYSFLAKFFLFLIINIIFFVILRFFFTLINFLK